MQTNFYSLVSIFSIFFGHIFLFGHFFWVGTSFFETPTEDIMEANLNNTCLTTYNMN